MEEDVHRYHGTDIEVTYDSNRCIHVRECVEGLPGVFDPEERPWIDADGATPDEIAAVVERCPTGALHYERTDDGPDEATPDRNTVAVATDGPLYLRGDVELRTAGDETLLTDTRIGLCRCGHSENKPLCDNSHHRVFEADGLDPDEVRVDSEPTGADDPERDDRDETDADGKLVVTLTKDGPVELAGPFDLYHDGEKHTHHESATLCRCGASGNKPFCDWSHEGIGFTTGDDE